MRLVYCAALVICVFVPVCLGRIPGDGTAANPVIVGCQEGQPPFSDAHPPHFECEGLFAEIFHIIMNRTGMAYTVTALNTDHIDELLVSNATDPVSEYDFIISFHTISPERLKIIKFSIALYATDWKLVLQPKYHQEPTTLVNSIIRDSVLYIFSIIALFAAAMTIVILVFEHLEPDAPLKEFPMWRRVFIAIEQGLETVVNASTNFELKSQVSRSCRLVFMMCTMVYLLGIMGAVVTSNLTASALAAKPVTVKDARGFRLAASSHTITHYLESIEIGAQVVEVPNVEIWGDEMFAGQHDDFDGFVAPTEEADFLYLRHGGKDKKFALSDAFQPTGAKDLKAFPFAANGVQSVLDRFNVEAERIRLNGELTRLVAKHVPAASAPPNNEFPVPETAFSVLKWICIVGFALIVISSAVLGVVTLVQGPQPPEPNTEPIEWRGCEPFQLEEHLTALVDSVVVQLKKREKDQDTQAAN